MASSKAIGGRAKASEALTLTELPEPRSGHHGHDRVCALPSSPRGAGRFGDASLIRGCSAAAGAGLIHNAGALLRHPQQDSARAPRLRAPNPALDQTDAKPIGAWQRVASTLDEWLDQSLLLDVFDGPLDQFGDVIRGFDALQGMWEMGEWQLAKRQLNGQSGDKVVFDEGDRRTILTPARRHFALNHHDPRILEGLRVSLEAIRLMNEQARERGIDFLVLLIPTKELVYAGDIIELAEIGDQFRRLVEVERFVRDHSQRFFEHHRIEYIDTLPHLREQLDQGPQPYRVSADGHPNRHGHHVIAKLASEALLETGSLANERR